MGYVWVLLGFPGRVSIYSCGRRLCVPGAMDGRPRYVCNLPPDVLDKAKRELNEPENSNARLVAIDKLRARFAAEAKDLELVRSDDAFLLRFLRVRKYDPDRAYNMLVNYHMHRKEWRELFDMIDDPKCLGSLLSRGPVVPLRERAKDGTFVILARPGFALKEGDSLLMLMACVLLTIEKLLENEEAQIYGITVIQDLSSLGLSVAMQMATHGRRIISLMQDGMPVRVKSLNLVNEALVFDAIYAIISRFMKEKLKRRIRLHGSNYDTLREKVDPAYLPAYLGGAGPDPAVDYWKEQLLSTVGKGEDTAM